MFHVPVSLRVDRRPNGKPCDSFFAEYRLIERIVSHDHVVSADQGHESGIQRLSEDSERKKAVIAFHIPVDMKRIGVCVQQRIALFFPALRGDNIQRRRKPALRIPFKKNMFLRRASPADLSVQGDHEFLSARRAETSDRNNRRK